MEDIFKFLFVIGIIAIGFVRQARKEAKTSTGNGPAMPMPDAESPFPENWNGVPYDGYSPENPRTGSKRAAKESRKRNISPLPNNLPSVQTPTICLPNPPRPHPNLKYTRQKRHAKPSSGERYYNESINAIENKVDSLHEKNNYNIMAFNYISAAEAASLIKHGYNIGLSGFTPAGTAKAVTAELAKIAEAEHAKGNPFQVGIFTGASTGDSCDGVLSRVKAIRYRAPYTTNPDFRKAVNNGEIAYNDIHLSQMAQEVRYGFMGKVNVAIIEACEVTPDGKIYLTAAGGIAPTICRLADQIIIELNAAHSKNAMGLHDVYEPLDPPYRREIPIFKPSDRIGQPYIQVDPKKIVGIVETNWPDEARSFAAADPLTDKIGQNVADFLAADMKRGIIPSTFLPLQSGVGNIANAVLGALGRDKTIPAFEMYTEVIQNSVIGLIREGRVKFGSACSLTVTNDCLNGIYEDMDFFRDKLVLRPSEISNSPEVVRRLGIISINTAIEADLYGNVNSTHIGGTKMMNGIGGSGDFTRNAYISIFTCPSVAKEGKISAIVPMVSHVDHSEHDVNIIVTEQGVADLRGKSPKRTCTGNHRELCSSGLQEYPVGLSETDRRQGADSSLHACRSGYARRTGKKRGYEECGLGTVQIKTVPSVKKTFQVRITRIARIKSATWIKLKKSVQPA